MRQASPGKLTHGRRCEWDTTGVLVDEAASRGPLGLRSLFGNGRPVELEIGTGKGTFLLARAAARPQLNFLGLEYARSYCVYAADRIRRAGLTNVRIVCGEAAHFVRVCLLDRCLWRVHIYFPDPWPKHRHHRRRLVQPAFVKQLQAKLRVGGQLLIVTDNLAYAAQIAAVLNNLPGFAVVPFPRMADSSGELVGTNFERKYISQGRAFYPVAVMQYR